MLPRRGAKVETKNSAICGCRAGRSDEKPEARIARNMLLYGALRAAVKGDSSRSSSTKTNQNHSSCGDRRSQKSGRPYALRMTPSTTITVGAMI